MRQFSRPTVVDTIVVALAKAMPDRVPAGHHGLLGGSVVFFGLHPKLAKDFEATIASARAFLYAASIMLLSRRIARAV